MKTSIKSILVALLTVAIIGCGGSGTTTTTNAYTGFYAGNYASRADSGGVVFQIKPDGSVDIQVNDTAYGEHFGTGTVSSSGVITGTATPPGATPGGPKTVTVSATITGSGATTVVNVTIGGAFTASITDGGLVSNGTASPFAGTYPGTYTEAGSTTPAGTFTMVISANGTIAVTAIIDGETATGTGTMSTIGATNATASGGGTGVDESVTFEGGAVIERVGGVWKRRLKGNWESTSGNKGTWITDQVSL